MFNLFKKKEVVKNIEITENRMWVETREFNLPELRRIIEDNNIVPLSDQIVTGHLTKMILTYYDDLLVRIVLDTWRHDCLWGGIVYVWDSRTQSSWECYGQLTARRKVYNEIPARYCFRCGSKII